MSAGRMWAIIVVALLHALIGYAFVTGLATDVIKSLNEDLKTFDVEEPPPPEEEPPPPPEQPQPSSPPPISAPPIARITPNQNPIQATPPQEQVSFTPDPPRQEPEPDRGPQTKNCPGGQTVPIDAACPEVRPRQQPRAPVHRGGTITNEDYPQAAIRAEASGTTVIRLAVGANGRVSGCTVSRSSGNSSLDSTACSLATRRFRFTPAQDENGNAVAGTVSRSIRWELPEQ
jgi:protein TonB